MYYDDEVRRFNFMSGLLLGSILGAALALFGRPVQRFSRPRRIRRGYARARDGAGSGVQRVRGGVADLISAAAAVAQKASQ